MAKKERGIAIRAKDNLRQHPNRVLPATITIVARKIGLHPIEPIIIQSGSLNRNYYLGMMNGCGEGLFTRCSRRYTQIHGVHGRGGRGKCTLPTSESAGAGQRSMEKHHRYNEGERKMAGDAGRRRGKHQESVTLRANGKIKRHSNGRGGDVTISKRKSMISRFLIFKGWRGGLSNFSYFVDFWKLLPIRILFASLRDVNENLRGGREIYKKVEKRVL